MRAQSHTPHRRCGMTQPCSTGGARGEDAGDGHHRAERSAVDGAGEMAAREIGAPALGGCIPVGAVAIAQSTQLCVCTTTHEALDSDSMCAYTSRRSSRHASAMAATEGATIWKTASRTRILDSRG